MEKLYLFNVYTFCKSLRVINVGSPYGVPWGTPYIFHVYMIRCGWLGTLLAPVAEDDTALNILCLVAVPFFSTYDLLKTVALFKNNIFW